MSSLPATPVHLEVFSADRNRQASALAGATAELLSDAVAEQFPPSVSVAVVSGTGPMLVGWTGWSNTVGSMVATTHDTVYDLASLTKVVATVPLCLVLVQQGKWRLSDPVSKWLRGFPRSDLTLWHLLTHTSGLVPHVPFYLQCRGVSCVRKALYAEASKGGPVDKVSYSDLNFILLGWALAACTGQPLERSFAELVAVPLGMSSTRFRPPARARLSIAATELDGDQRLRPGLVWGEVHDGNAWALGGVSGHAGLFAAVADLARFVQALLAPARHPVLSAESIAEMTSYQAGELPDVRGLGWRLQPQDWGPWPESSYWHTGFTGTSLLVAPEAGLGVVLATNAVHPHRRLEAQAAFRSRAHNMLAKEIL